MVEKIIVGVISDTHGRLSPQAEKALEGVDQIIHAGDFDIPKIHELIQKIAPMKAVRGNMDRGLWANILPQQEMVEVGEVTCFVVHDLLDMEINPQAAGVNIVVYGHTHRAEKQDRNGIMFLNPGSASSPRGSRQASVAIIKIEGNKFDIEHIRWAV